MRNKGRQGAVMLLTAHAIRHKQVASCGQAAPKSNRAVPRLKRRPTDTGNDLSKAFIAGVCRRN